MMMKYSRETPDFIMDVNSMEHIIHKEMSSESSSNEEQHFAQKNKPKKTRRQYISILQMLNYLSQSSQGLHSLKYMLDHLLL